MSISHYIYMFQLEILKYKKYEKPLKLHGFKKYVVLKLFMTFLYFKIPY